MTEKVVLIIDGLNLFTRHYIAHPAIGENGDPVGGIVGFLYGVVSLAERCKPTDIIVVWEGGGSTKRRSIFSDYKKKRRPQKLNRYYDDDIPNTVENRNYQVSTIVSILNHVPVIQMYVPDCEADDVIGYLCRYSFKDCKKVILSSDKDFYQLLDDKTIIYSPTWKRFVNSIEIKKKFNISPVNFSLAKSICGDISDNIDGVKGVGFKTIAKRFPAMNHDTDVLISDIVSESKKMIDEGSKVKAFSEIIKSESKIRRNWKLIYLDTQNLSSTQINKINSSIDNFCPKRSKIEVMRKLLKEGIKTFNIDRMFLSLRHIKET